jgi:hypothetical protein
MAPPQDGSPTPASARSTGLDSDDYKQGYQDGLSGGEDHPTPRAGDALTDYEEGYAKGHQEFSQKSPSKSSSGTNSEADRVANLEQNYAGWLAEEDWQRVAETLNGFNSDDIKKKLSKLTHEQIEKIEQGAFDNPRVGQQAQVVKLCREQLSGDDSDLGDTEVHLDIPETTEQQVERILHGTDKVVSLVEAANWVLRIEAVEHCSEPISAVIALIDFGMGFGGALNIERSTLGYQGYAYGLLRSCAGMPDPTPNPTWPDAKDVDNDYSTFNEGVTRAKEHAKDVRRSNHILLAMAKYGPQAVLQEVWQAIISENDAPLKNFNPRWPNVTHG